MLPFFVLHLNRSMEIRNPDSMTGKQKQFIVLLILGLVFSSILRITFNLSDGFVCHDLSITPPFPLFDYADKGSTHAQLTSTFFGYVLFLLAGFTFIGEIKEDQRWLMILLGFVAITLYAAYFEFSSLMADINGKYEGEHAWVGPTLFLLGLLIYFKSRTLPGK